MLKTIAPTTVKAAISIKVILGSPVAKYSQQDIYLYLEMNQRTKGIFVFMTSLNRSLKYKACGKSTTYATLA